MLRVHSLTFHARLRQTKTTNCPSVSRCSFSFTSFREISFSFTTANVNEKRLDRVRDGCEIDSRVKRLYCFTSAERGRTLRWNFDNNKLRTMSDILFAENCFVKFSKFRFWNCENFKEYLSTLFRFRTNRNWFRLAFLLTYSLSIHLNYFYF